MTEVAGMCWEVGQGWGRGGVVPSSDPYDPLALIPCKFLLIELPACWTANLWEDRNTELMAPIHILSLAWSLCQSFKFLSPWPPCGCLKPSPEGMELCQSSRVRPEDFLEDKHLDLETWTRTFHYLLKRHCQDTIVPRVPFKPCDPTKGSQVI